MRRFIAALLVVFASLALAPAGTAEVIDGDRGKRLAARLAGLGARPAGRHHEYQAAKIVQRILRDLGYAVTWQRFQIPNGLYSRNVVGRTPGPTRVVVVAHMDGVWGTVAANDNGSGVGGTMEVARVLKDTPGLLVAALGAEERHVTGSPYHLGSLRLLRSLSASEREGIRLVVSLDMIAVGSTLNVRGIESSPNRSARKLLRTAERIGIRASYLQDPGVSDHAEFSRAGVPATLLTWRWDACWHEPCDRPRRLDPFKLRRAARLTMVAANATLN
jgi:hypothetical protein